MQTNDLLLKGSMITLTLMVLGMVVIGGITRLTGSGLSIVEWKPIIGILPPLNAEQWILEFAKYQQSPEFQKINFGMTLSEFQSIFWLEYIHRLWGRLLGVIFLVPTLLIFLKNRNRKLWRLMALLWILGAGQGVMGWLMVKSGLNHDPHVSPYRLAAHLMLGFAIFGVATWITLSLFEPNLKVKQNHNSLILKKLTVLALVTFLLTAFLGAIVAGLKAGLVYNTFPYMGERLIPHEFLTQIPWWRDILENPVSVQFLHRCLAILTTFICLSLWIYQRRFQLPKLLSYALTSIACAALFQLVLGITTLLFLVPIGLASLHQCFAFILFGCLLSTLYLLKQRPSSPSLRGRS